MSIVKQPACPKCGKKVFELRMLKDEGVAAVRCVACERHFLLLDSGDYWFDVIQQGYPRLARCTCKSERFRLSLDYRFRDDGDVETVTLTTQCAKCQKGQRRMTIEIDYSPTKQLVNKPLVPCKNPEIRYDLHQLSLYAKAADIARVAEYLASQGCSFAGQVREGDEPVTKKLTLAQAKAAIIRRGYLPGYRQIYAMPSPISLTESAVSTARKEDKFWKRHEVVRIESPMTMVWGSREGLLYYIYYCNQFIDGESIVDKSQRFRELTAGLVEWLGKKYVAWRGADCFDNEQVHRKLFGSEFRAKAGRRK